MRQIPKILLIDDEESANFLHKAIIRHSKCADEVVAATRGMEALSYLEEEMNGGILPDLIFLDVNMPNMSGWEFIDVYKEYNIKFPVLVMLTSSIDPRDVQKANDIDVISAFRSKPLTFDTLGEIMDEFFS